MKYPKKALIGVFSGIAFVVMFIFGFGWSRLGKKKEE